MTWKFFLFTCLLGLGLPFAISLPAQANNVTISNLSGRVEVKGQFSLFWGRARRYQELSPNHRVRVGNQSFVTITCLDANANWMTWTISAGEAQMSDRCAPRVFPSRSTGPTRSPIDENRPYIITPRNTALLPGSIDIAWSGVPNANTYRVRIRGLGGFSWESDRLTATTAQYTESLETGRTYEITVETDRGLLSNPSGSVPPTFRILTEAEVSRVNQELAQIEALALDPTAHTLAIAQAYRNHNLNQNAIAVLTTQIQSGTQSAAVYQLQGSIYEQIGLTRQAREQYNRALGLTDADDLEQQANLQERLGLVARSVANYAEAVIWLQAAEANYRQLLDASLPEVQQQLQSLKRLLEDSQSRLPASALERQSTAP
ncbi:hypothetical protein ACQ4M4_13760 [Leptolyngbya sp. AN02str]|uniref:tetratricopeptide repeat protein n=1 Tax=Leptolyngbya sp. AN02str TaxID=3423363 RepID=UPI003D3217BF